MLGGVYLWEHIPYHICILLICHVHLLAIQKYESFLHVEEKIIELEKATQREIGSIYSTLVTREEAASTGYARKKRLVTAVSQNDSQR